MFITLQVGRCNVLTMGNNKTTNPPYYVTTQNLSLGQSMLKLHCILCVFDHCLSHGELKFNTWAHHNCLNVVPFINLNLFSQKERYVMCICSLSPSLLSRKSIKLNEDSSPIPIKIKSSSSRFRPTKVQFSKFQLKHPQWTKKKQAAQLCLIPQAVKPYFGYQDHCLILKFIVLNFGDPSNLMVHFLLVSSTTATSPMISSLNEHSSSPVNWVSKSAMA